MGRLNAKVAIISGAARGQGAAEAASFLAEGARVVVADVLDGEGKALVAELGEGATYVHLDVTNPDEWSSTVAMTVEQFGRLDILVNNAGIIRFGAVASLSLEDYLAVVNVNQVGTFLGMQAAIPAMVDAGGGSIINISSIDGINPMPGVVAYAASKFAVRGMTKVAAMELGPVGIRVNSVHPGGVATPMTGSEAMGIDVGPLFSKIPLGRIGQPEDIAPLVVYLASDESAYCTGAEFVVDGGAIAGHTLG